MLDVKLTQAEMAKKHCNSRKGKNELLFPFTSCASGESSHTLSHGNPASSHLHGSKQLFFVLLTDLSQSFSCFSLLTECSGVFMNLLIVLLTITMGQVGMNPSSHKHGALILCLLGALGSKLRL